MRLALAATLTGLSLGAAVLAEEPPASGATPGTASDRVLAEGSGGNLTQDGVDAYIEALEFILAQMGQPTDFKAAQRTSIGDSLASHYPELPVEIQEDLANLRPIWSHYMQTWPLIGPEARRDFAFTVLALAFGAEKAAAALGMELDPGTERE